MLISLLVRGKKERPRGRERERGEKGRKKKKKNIHAISVRV